MKTNLGMAVLLVGLVVSGSYAADRVQDAYGPSAKPRADAERLRVQRHLTRVERELRQADTSGLTASQRRARRDHIERLADYRRSGTFPHNHDYPGVRRPYFVDRHGTLCAMAFLIEASGRRDIVDLVAKRDNNATVSELAKDPTIGVVLKDWLYRAGLTVEEAQRVQPGYGGLTTGSSEGEIPTGYAIASVGLGALNLVSIGWNGASARSGEKRDWVPAVSSALGAASVILGATAIDNGGERKTLGIVNITLGAASIIASAVAAARGREPSPFVQQKGSTLAIRATAEMKRSGPAVGVRAFF